MIRDVSNWSSRALPGADPLEGRFVTVLPTDPERDAAPLFEVLRSGDPVLWDYLPYGPFEDEAEFAIWLSAHVRAPGLFPRTIVNRGNGMPVGNASFMSIAQDHGDLEIGNIFFSPTLQRTRMATEAMYLMMRHAFDDLGYRRVVWKCDANNARSMRAATRYGFRHEGHFRQHKVIKGKNRDTAWYSVIDGEWLIVKAAFEAWLNDANFDDDGAQLKSLTDIRAFQN